MNGVICGEVFWGYSSNYNYTELNQYDPPLNTWIAGNSKSGSLNRKINSQYLHNKNGAVSETYKDIMYNNLWIKPTSFAFGLINSDRSYDVYVWNTKDSQITLNNITYYSTSGVEVLTGTLPQTYQSTEEKHYTLEVYKNGDAVIDGYALFNFDIYDYYLNLTGKRLVDGKFACRGNNIKIPYSFTNTKSVTLKQVEERRNIVDVVKRKISFSLMTRDKNYIENAIRYGQDKVFGIPIIIEPVHTTDTGNLKGSQDIYIEEDMTNMYNMQKTEYISFYNPANGDFEINEVSSIDNGNKIIHLGAPVVGDFISPLIFPVMLCYLEDYSLSMKTKDVSQYNFTFREM